MNLLQIYYFIHSLQKAVRIGEDFFIYNNSSNKILSGINTNYQFENYPLMNRTLNIWVILTFFEFDLELLIIIF